MTENFLFQKVSDDDDDDDDMERYFKREDFYGMQFLIRDNIFD